MDCSLPSSSAHEIFLARILDWVPFLPLGDLPNPGIEPAFLASRALAGGFFTLVSSRKPCIVYTFKKLFEKIWQ